jgi:hypothetical protein
LFVAMRRAFVIAGVMLAGLLAAAPPAGAAGPRSDFIFFERAGGFSIEGRSTIGGERIRLRLFRHGEVAYYYAPARIGDATVRARFGGLGSLDLRFRPGPGEGEVGCGTSGGWQEGTFAGSFVFRGEHDYAGVNLERLRGWLRAPSPGGCSAGRDQRAAPASASRVDQVAETGVVLESRVGERLSGRYLYAFTVQRHGHSRVLFEAYRDEEREGMLIERGAEVFAAPATFDWDLGDGTARLEPPAPFSGRAFYREGGGGRSERWSGSLRAPVLGGRPIRLTGGDFETKLTLGSPFE